MAGYYIYSIESDVFGQLTTSPTTKQAVVLADWILDVERYAHYDLQGNSLWPCDRDAMADILARRLTSSDWYSDLSYADALVWDEIVYSLQTALMRSTLHGTRSGIALAVPLINGNSKEARGTI